MAYVTLGDVELWWEGHGSGPVPLVMVHGFTGSSDDWADVAPVLAHDRRVVVVDLRGHGRSTNTGDAASYGLDSLTADLTGFLSELEIGRCDLLGHSLGGMVALRHTLRRPETVRSLVLMDTSPEAIEGEGVEAFLTRQADTVRAEGMAALIAAADSAPLVGEDAAIAAIQGEDHHRRRTREKLRAMDPAALVGITSVLCHQDGVTHRLAEIRCPTTVIVGADDRALVGPAGVLADEIQGATLWVMGGAGHNPQKSAPESWMAAMQDHLRRADQRG